MAEIPFHFEQLVHPEAPISPGLALERLAKAAWGFRIHNGVMQPDMAQLFREHAQAAVEEQKLQSGVNTFPTNLAVNWAIIEACANPLFIKTEGLSTVDLLDDVGILKEGENLEDEVKKRYSAFLNAIIIIDPQQALHFLTLPLKADFYAYHAGWINRLRYLGKMTEYGDLQSKKLSLEDLHFGINDVTHYINLDASIFGNSPSHPTIKNSNLRHAVDLVYLAEVAFAIEEASPGEVKPEDRQELINIAQAVVDPNRILRDFSAPASGRDETIFPWLHELISIYWALVQNNVPEDDPIFSRFFALFDKAYKGTFDIIMLDPNVTHLYKDYLEWKAEQNIVDAFVNAVSLQTP